MCLAPIFRLEASSVVRAFPSIVGLVGNLSEFASKEGFVGRERVRVTVRYRNRYSEGEDYYRSRCIEEVLVFYPWAHALNRPRAVLFVGSSRAWEPRYRHVFWCNVYASRCIGFSALRSLRGLLAALPFRDANRRFGPSERAGRRFLRYHVVLLHRGFDQDRGTDLRSVIRHRRRARRYRRNLTATRVSLRRAIRLLTASRVLPSFPGRAFLHSNRFGERVAFVGTVGGATCVEGRVSPMFLFSVSYMPCCVGLCVGRFFGLRAGLDFSRILYVAKVVGVPWDLVRERRVRQVSRPKEWNFKGLQLRFFGRYHYGVLREAKVRSYPLRFLHHVMVKLRSRFIRVRDLYHVCVQVDGVSAAIGVTQSTGRGVVHSWLMGEDCVLCPVRPSWVRGASTVHGVYGRAALSSFAFHFGARGLPPGLRVERVYHRFVCVVGPYAISVLVERDMWRVVRHASLRFVPRRFNPLEACSQRRLSIVLLWSYRKVRSSGATSTAFGSGNIIVLVFSLFPSADLAKVPSTSAARTSSMGGKLWNYV